MGKIIKKTDFFAKKMDEPDTPPVPPVEECEEERRMLLSPQVSDCVIQAQKELERLNQPELAKAVAQAKNTACTERFCVAVVGEFSRGKSAFLNALLEREILPTANLPTTAMLTRIRYHKKPTLCYLDPKGNRRAALPLTEKSLEKLSIRSDGKGPRGMVLVGLDYHWLRENCIELMDTPGAGDLDKAHAAVIADALLSADGAVIAVSATAALSMSEKLFIEQRLIARKTPFLMMILTKLDLVPLNQRLRVLDYVEKKLDNWGMSSIPVFLPYQVELPGESPWKDRMGMEVIRKQLVSWRNHPKRMALTEAWLLARTKALVETAAQGLAGQKELLDADENKRKEKIAQKEQILAKAETEWEELRIQLLERCTKCGSWLEEKIQESTQTIVERLQYEASMSGNPQKWWKESYPYRVKVELTNLATSLDGNISRRFAEDAKWFNQALERRFQSRAHLTEKPEATKTVLTDEAPLNKPQFENLDRQRNAARVGTAVLTVAGAILCSSIGVFPLVVTMGVGTGSTILTEQMFRGKVEKQREIVRQAVQDNVPELIAEATGESEKKLRIIYDSLLEEARKQEALWLQTQKQAIAKSSTSASQEQKERLEQDLQTLEQLSHRLSQLS